MGKISINELIANDIVHYGIDSTLNYNYIVSLEDYTCDMDEETIDYINKHVEEINVCIMKNENVAEVSFNKELKEFDMVFWLDSVFDRIEKRIYNTGKIFDLDLSVENVKRIAEDVLDDDALNDDITNKVKSCDKRMEF